VYNIRIMIIVFIVDHIVITDDDDHGNDDIDLYGPLWLKRVTKHNILL